MKIAIIGTHGSGKTTLALNLIDQLSKKHPNISIGFLQEVAGRCPLKINRGGLQSQIWIIQKQIVDEIELEQKYDIVVCDRSILDAYVYTRDVCTFYKLQMPEWIEKLLEYHIESYDYIFKTRLNPNYLVKDNIRSTGMQWQEIIEGLFTQILQEKKIKSHDLPDKDGIKFILDTVSLKT